MFTNEINNSSWEGEDGANCTSSCQDDGELWLRSKPVASARRAMGCRSGRWLQLSARQRGSLGGLDALALS